MIFGNITAKQLMACSAIIEILQIFADTEIGGQYEIDYEAITNYLDSLKFSADYFDCENKEDVYERFTQDIYNGLPVWRWLELPEWTMNMVEKSFKDELQAEYKEMCKIYKCLTCKYHEVSKTDIGVLEKCTYTEEKLKNMHDRRYILKRDDEPFEPKKKCKNYIHIKSTTDTDTRGDANAKQ